MPYINKKEETKGGWFSEALEKHLLTTISKYFEGLILINFIIRSLLRTKS